MRSRVRGCRLQTTGSPYRARHRDERVDEPAQPGLDVDRLGPMHRDEEEALRSRPSRA